MRPKIFAFFRETFRSLETLITQQPDLKIFRTLWSVRSYSVFVYDQYIMIFQDSLVKYYPSFLYTAYIRSRSFITKIHFYRLPDIYSIYTRHLQYIYQTSTEYIPDIYSIYTRHLQYIYLKSSEYMQDIQNIYQTYVYKIYNRHLQFIFILSKLFRLLSKVKHRQKLLI